MTIFDLLFIVLFLTAAVTVIMAIVSFLRGKRQRATTILRRLAYSSVAYVGIVYLATALSSAVVLHPRDPECYDDWCVDVEAAQRMAQPSGAHYDVTLRIFSQARGRPQREALATDVYLLDSRQRRYDPILKGTEIPLNTLLQPGESVTTSRAFDLPSDAHDIGLVVGRRSPFPICLIIGECEAFHKGTIIRID
jgi:hypothetical protein